jgi:hypothetical protein
MMSYFRFLNLDFYASTKEIGEMSMSNDLIQCLKQQNMNKTLHSNLNNT